MGRGHGDPGQRPRELRRKVLLPARLRSACGWADACILNVSSRGLLIHGANALPEGSRVELRHGSYAIYARVVWRDGSRAGLQADDRVPVEEIMSLSRAPALQLTASEWRGPERRNTRRDHERSRQQARIREFAAATVVAGWVAISLAAVVQESLAQPLKTVRQALAGAAHAEAPASAR